MLVRTSKLKVINLNKSKEANLNQCVPFFGEAELWLGIGDNVLSCPTRRLIAAEHQFDFFWCECGEFFDREHSVEAV